MSEATLAKIQTDVRTEIVGIFILRLLSSWSVDFLRVILREIHILLFPSPLFSQQCSKMEAELAVYKRLQPLSTSCQSYVELYFNLTFK